MKNYRENELKWYILAYLFLVIGLTSPELFSSKNSDILASVEKFLTSSFLAGVVCTLAFVFDCLYSAEAKNLLVCLGFLNMPGQTIFTRIVNLRINDIRFDAKDAKTKYREIIENLPHNNKERRKYENKNWYLLSRKHEKNPRVESSHRDFLLCRDLYITTITLTSLTIIGVNLHIIQLSWILFGYLFFMLLITNIATHVRANRFVNSVIAVDMTSNGDERIT